MRHPSAPAFCLLQIDAVPTEIHVHAQETKNLFSDRRAKQEDGMGAVVHVLFWVLSGVGGFLLTANIALGVLKIAHRRTEARRLAMALAPMATYFRLGDMSEVDRSHEHHI